MSLIKHDYIEWFEQIKRKIKIAQLKISLSTNAQLLQAYWELGEAITQKQQESNWGEAILEQLSVDLRMSFPKINGFSKRNLYAIRQWYLFYRQQYEFVPQAVAQIPWGHNRLIISKIKNIDEALAYAQATMQNGWSRDMLEVQIKNNYLLTIVCKRYDK